ncbi:MAG: HEPN domain-containing protein [Candidatus Atribacteria bacterium]|nr:HEPN domain-containing protein [Candidatus Atribacteria bacterium]
MKEDTRKLLEKATRAVNTAKLLIEHGDLDFAVSRAYYAMFYTACALLFERGFSFRKHSAAIAAFGEHFAKAGKIDPRFHRSLINAHDLRLVGDYAIGVELNQRDVESVIEEAKIFLRVAEEYLTTLENDEKK